MSAADVPNGVFHTLKTKVHRNSTETDKISLMSDSSRRAKSTTSVTSSETQEEPKRESEPLIIGAQKRLDEDPRSQGDTSNKVAISKPIQDPTVESTTAAPEPVSGFLESLIATHPFMPVETIARLTTHSDTRKKDQSQEMREKVKQGIIRATELGLAAPLDLAESLAQGFHNVPRLYNDTTVRPQENVTGFQSGLKAASMDFAHGIYDGVTGVVTQPINGAKEGGIGGFVAGVGKGLGGLILKPTGGKLLCP